MENQINNGKSNDGMYTETQNPIERLRNKLTPFISLVEVLGSDDIVSPFIENSNDNIYKNEMVERLIDRCKTELKNVSFYLSDVENFYKSAQPQPDWIEVNERMPITYISGNFDGKNSDQVIVETKDGKRYLAHFNDGFMDGSEFKDWYDDRDYLIDVPVIRWMKIPY